MTGRDPVGLLWLFMIQFYELPARRHRATWSNIADRYVELKPRRHGAEFEAAEYCMHRMQAYIRSSEPKFRALVKECRNRTFRGAFVLNLDGARTPSAPELPTDSRISVFWEAI
ncbi:hypothetical protein ACF08M_33260 [Streptomyces sp. NPDC015032]|uniref:hypothetical protein n=1 Tax=Streptomyces sp. NPDC015032 TaxID=3364937 RepID=UPI0036F9F209